jgi:hypothetical protein
MTYYPRIKVYVQMLLKVKQSKTVPLHAMVATSALDGGEWSASRLSCALASGKGPPVPTVQGLGGPQSQSGHRG